ncbi:DUF4214 domain-containing protein [Methylobacterium nigriterrae]|uniref:DUF4214 domain-containing protein n=1 Tax=Methylobacterium nigriterrae TaxID=3127512 RepID=UPI003013C0C0
MALTADQLNTIYQNVLFRNVDAAGIAYFGNSNLSDAQVRQQIELSAEANTFVSPIVRLYQEVLGRVPDAAGLRFFSTELRQGFTLEQVTQQFLSSAEFTARTTAIAGAVDATDLNNTNQLVTDAFQALLNRSPATSEFAYFQGKTPAQILSAIAGSPEAASQNAAGVVTFLDQVAQGTYPTGTLNDKTFTTALNEHFNGTTGSETFTAVLGGAGATFTAGETADGGGSSDVLNATVTGNITTTASGSTTNIETINLSLATGAAGTVDASKFVGATAINETIAATGGASAFLNVSNVGPGQTVSFDSNGTHTVLTNTVTVTDAAASVNVKIADLGSGSTLTFAETTAGKGNLLTETVTGAVHETGAVVTNSANLGGSSTSELFLIGTTKETTVNLGITSNTYVHFGTGAGEYAGLQTIDASASTGNLELHPDLATLTKLSSLTLGSGNDFVTETLVGKTGATLTYSLGAGNDTFTLDASATGTAGDHATSITLGSGADTLTISTGVANIQAATSGSVTDASITANLITVTDFSAATGGDILHFTAIAAANRDTVTTSGAGNEQTAINGAATLKAALDIAASNTTAGHYQVFDYKGDAYIYVENAAGHVGSVAGTADTVKAGDGLIKVTGVTVAQLDAGHLTV